MSCTNKYREMIRGMKRNDSKAWEQFDAEFRKRLIGFVKPKVRRTNVEDFEDIIQNILLGVRKNISEFDENRCFENWLLYGIALKKIGDYVRRRERSGVIREDRQIDSGIGTFRGPTPSEAVVINDIEKVVARALRRLANEYRDNGEFQTLKVLELLYHKQEANKSVAKWLRKTSRKFIFANRGDLKSWQDKVARIKYQAKKRFDELLKAHRQDSSSIQRLEEQKLMDEMWFRVWQREGVSCPDETKLGSYLLEVLPNDWADYIDFHLKEIGCEGCRETLVELGDKV